MICLKTPVTYTFKNRPTFGNFLLSNIYGNCRLCDFSFSLIILVHILYIGLAIKIIYGTTWLLFNMESFDLISLFFSLGRNNDCCFDTNDWLVCRLSCNTTPVTKMVSLPNAVYDFIGCGSLDWWCNATFVSACEYLWNCSIWTYKCESTELLNEASLAECINPPVKTMMIKKIC